MLLAFSLPAVIFGVVAGGVVDRFPKREVLVFSNLSRFILLLGYFFFSRSLVSVFAITILISIVTQLFIPAEAPMIPELVDKKYLLTANSLFTISYILSTIVGFILAGPMIKVFGITNIFLFMSALMFFAYLLVYRLPKNIRGDTRENLDFTILGKTIDEGIRYIGTHSRIKDSLILITFAQALVTTLAVLAPGFADKVLNIDLTDSSFLVLGPSAIGLVTGAFLIGAYGNRYLKGSMIMTGILATGINLIILGLLAGNISSGIWFQGLLTIVILLFTLGFFNSFINVPANTILQAETDSCMRGRIYGVMTSLTGGVSFIPVVVSGILADITNTNFTLMVIGAFVTGIGFLKLIQRLHVLNGI